MDLQMSKDKLSHHAKKKKPSAHQILEGNFPKIIGPKCKSIF